MQRIAVFLLMGAMIYFASCSDDKNPAESTPRSPIFSVSLQDSNGDPVSGWLVGSINHPIDGGIIFDARKPCPDTGISFSLPDASDWTLTIYDYNGNAVWSDTGQSSDGSLYIIWDGLDDAGDPVFSGFYRYHLTAGNFEDEKWRALERFPQPADAVIGELDADGKFSTSNIALFPGLIANQPIEYYTDTVTVCLMDPDAGPGGEAFLFAVKLNRDVNDLSFLMDSMGITLIGGNR